MKALCSSENLVDVYKITQPHFTEESFENSRAFLGGGPLNITLPYICRWLCVLSRFDIQYMDKVNFEFGFRTFFPDIIVFLIIFLKNYCQNISTLSCYTLYIYNEPFFGINIRISTNINNLA
jgi:hypothetical protein